MDENPFLPALAPRPPLPAEPTSALTATQLLAAFLAGRGRETLRSYRQDLADFAAFVGADSLEAAAARLLGHGHGEANLLALSYRAHLMGRDLAAATVNHRLAALRSLDKVGQRL